MMANLKIVCQTVCVYVYIEIIDSFEFCNSITFKIHDFTFVCIYVYVCLFVCLLDNKMIIIFYE